MELAMRVSTFAKGLTETAHALFYVMACGVLISVPVLAWQQASGTLGIPHLLACLVFAVAVGLAAFRFRATLAAGLRALLAHAGKVPPLHWLVGVTAGGVALRAAWALAFPAGTASDGAIYLALAHKLAAGETYFIAGSYAYWPPGYPMFLTAWLHLPLPDPTIALLSNLILYVLTSMVLWRLADRVGGAQAARLATLLLAAWPNYLANSVTAEKENLLIFLLPTVLLLYAHRSGKLLPRLIAGVLLGCAALVQPSVLLFPSVLLCYELLQRRPWRSAIASLAVLAIGMALVIAPWSARNQRVFGEFLLISSNGGENLYRANNPLATGGYTKHGEVDLDNLGELERGRTGFKLAKTWIGSHPVDFAGLVLAKQKLFLGDDSFGPYVSIRLAGGNEKLYLVMKLVANAFWYGLWACLLALWYRRSGMQDPALHTTLVLGYAYFFVLHSVFESGGKYHLAPLALLAAFGAAQLASACSASRSRQAAVIAEEAVPTL
jgi:hypothetical protein